MTIAQAIFGSGALIAIALLLGLFLIARAIRRFKMDGVLTVREPTIIGRTEDPPDLKLANAFWRMVEHVGKITPLLQQFLSDANAKAADERKRG